MTLEEKINADIKQAMLAREKEKLEALRAVKSAVLLAKTEKTGAELDEQIEIKLNGRSVNHYIKPVKDDKIEIDVFDNKITIIFNNIKKYTDLTNE
jgi:DNA polymerase III sliding clamp (beta) subunit (PCNA family)